jgi:23S rRNA (guanosine2251-2'-O)-methyltransferase
MRLSVICHDIRSVHNVGSIFRTADAAGVEKIYLCGITPSPRDRFGKIRPDFAKVSLGAEKSVACESIKSTEEAIQKLKADGWTVLALEQSEKSIPYDKIPKSYLVSHKSCLLLGAEVEGLPPAVLALADHVIEIPMRGAKESLNVSVAFGIAIFEIVRKSAVDGRT